MTIKSYVVRGKSDGEVWMTAATLADVLGETPIIAEARILAVHADGTEAPLPPYEDALSQLAAIDASIPTSIVTTHTEHGDPMPIVERVRILATEATHEIETATALAAARAEIERLRGVVDLARRLIQSVDLHATNGERAGITCNEEPYAALVAVFEAERENERLIPGLVCAECDRPIYRGWEYAGKGGHAAHRACREWPKGTVFKVAGAQEGQM